MPIPWKLMTKTHLTGNSQLTTKEIIYSLALGDGTLSCATSKGTSCITICHSPKQLDYLLYKQNLLSSINIDSQITERDVYLKSTNKTYKNYRLRSKSYVEIGDIEKILYQRDYQLGSRRHHKVLKDFSYFNTFSLYLLCLDDMTRHTEYSNYATLCTENFHKEDVDNFLDYVSLNYNLSLRLHKRNSKYRVYFPACELTKAKSIMKPYINLVPSMAYKFI